MRKFLFITFLSAVLFSFSSSTPTRAEGVYTPPTQVWAKNHGWELENYHYIKTIDNVNYKLSWTVTEYDRILGKDSSCQIITVESPDASGKVIIPAEIDGYPVTSIGWCTFSHNKNITECIVPSSVEEIGMYAFNDCHNLSKITIDEGLKVIGFQAFMGTINLTKIALPSSLEYLSTHSIQRYSETLGIQELIFKGNAPTLTDIDEFELSDISSATIKAYEASTGWNEGLWANININIIPRPTETEIPTVTETPAATPTKVPSTPPPVESEPPTENKPSVVELYTDIYDDWYTEYVQYVFDRKLMTGIKGTTFFLPNDFLTKAQIVKVLYNIEGEPAGNTEDVFDVLIDVSPYEWYANAIAWSYDKGIVTGDTNTKRYNPDSNVTREQLALILYRYSKYKGYDLSSTSNLIGLKNAENVSDWAEKGVKWAVGNGLISGIDKKGVKDLAPQGSATRAQYAAILKRYLEKFEIQE